MERLFGRYGTLVQELIDLIAADPALAEPLPGAPDYLRAEIVYAATHEGALTLEDVLTRRTHISIETADRGVDSAEAAAALVGGALGWSPARRRQEVAGHHERMAADRRSELTQDGQPRRQAAPTGHRRAAGHRTRGAAG